MRIAVLAAALCFSVGLAVAGDAEASMKKHTDIPAQALGTALKALAKERGIQLVFRSEVVGSIRTHGATGELTTREALTKLLDGTDLVYSFLDENTVTIMPKSEVQPGSAAGPEDPGRGGSSNQPTTQEQQKSDAFRVAQVDQGTPAASSTVNREDEQESKKKPVVLQEVVVTGTHIQGSANPSAPLMVIDRDEIERSGYQTLQQLVATIPQNFGGGAVGATEDGPLGPGGLTALNRGYGTGINLRGLGNSSSLVLVNGHRLAPSSDGTFADVSMIPLTAIDRIEVMTDGASAIYGADAVAGVVNFILRKDYDGQETWGSYGSGTDGSRKQTVVGQSIGRNWEGGNAVGSFQYQKLGALSANDRSYTAAPSSLYPTDLLPGSDQYSGLFNIRQDLGAGFDIASDILYSHKKVSGQAGTDSFLEASSSVIDAGVAAIDVGYQVTNDWRIDASGSFSKDHTDTDTNYIPFGFFRGFHDSFSVGSGDIVANGLLFHTPGGDVKVALGASYRSERQVLLPIGFVDTVSSFDRHVTAEFAELALPVIGAANAQPGIRQLELSLAVRRDDYSDFGATSNPRYGLSWKPVNAVHIRGAYSTSFRAPNAFEQENATFPPSLYEELFPGPAGGSVPVFYQTNGGGPPLKPEKSRNVTVGMDLEPKFLPNFKASVDYFNIRYKDRITTPTFDAAALSELSNYGPLITQLPSDAAAQAYINTVLSEGGSYFDGTCGPDGVTGCIGPTGVRYVLNGYELNAALVRTSGMDLALNYRFSVSSNEFRVRLDATRIYEILTSLTENLPAMDLSNTYANPLHWRGRGELGWTHGRWSINTAVNFSGSYTDTTTVPFATVASWTTVDAQLSYALPLAKSASLSLSATNILDKDPPYVFGSGLFNSHLHYDVGNANPLGRVLVLSARVEW